MEFEPQSFYETEPKQTQNSKSPHDWHIPTGFYTLELVYRVPSGNKSESSRTKGSKKQRSVKLVEIPLYPGPIVCRNTRITGVCYYTWVSMGFGVFKPRPISVQQALYWLNYLLRSLKLFLKVRNTLVSLKIKIKRAKHKWPMFTTTANYSSMPSVIVPWWEKIL